MSYSVAITAVLLFCTARFNEGVPLVDQETRGGQILSVTIDGCDQDDCKLAVNETYKVTTTFKAKYSINGGLFLIGTLYSVSLAPLLQVPVCDTVKPECGKVDESIEYSITTQLRISEFFPLRRLNLYFYVEHAQRLRLFSAASLLTFVKAQ